MADDQKKLAERGIEIAEYVKREMEIVEDKHEKASSKIRVHIDQIQSLRDLKNQYWFELINDRLQKYQTHHHRQVIYNGKNQY
jgi:hypothetical protein